MTETGIYPRARLDALTDGIYAVAMTLLVLDIRLPEEARDLSNAELFSALVHLWPKLLPYIISFLVLGFHWMSTVKTRTRAEHVGRHHAMWMLFGLLLVTFLPFTATVLGRFPGRATAVCLYSANIALLAFISLWTIVVRSEFERDWRAHERIVASVVLLTSALLAAAASFLAARYATWLYLLNLIPPFLRSLRKTVGE